MVRDKVRIRFHKGGDLRLVSHHDLLRCWERMLRRSGLPYHSTGGFHPLPRLMFALSLPLGVEGLNEVAELELTAEIPPDEILERLRQQAPPGLSFHRLERIPPRFTAQVHRCHYRLPLPPDRVASTHDRAAALLLQSALWVEREKPKRRRIDLRPYLIDLTTTADALLWINEVTPTGTARPVEMLACLGIVDLLDRGAVLQRTDLELHPDGIAPVLPANLPETQPPDSGSLEEGEPPIVRLPPDRGASPAPATWGASPQGPVVE